MVALLPPKRIPDSQLVMLAGSRLGLFHESGKTRLPLRIGHIKVKDGGHLFPRIAAASLIGHRQGSRDAVWGDEDVLPRLMRVEVPVEIESKLVVGVDYFRQVFVACGPLLGKQSG